MSRTDVDQIYHDTKLAVFERGSQARSARHMLH
jgi:hypothetical protein